MEYFYFCVLEWNNLTIPVVEVMSLKKWILDTNRKLLHFLGYTLYAVVYIGIFVLIVWVGIKLDLGGDPYDKDGNPDVDIYQQYNGR